MNTKLTLRMDEETIDRIKIFAAQKHISISKLAERLFENLLDLEESINNELSPIAKKYKGILSGLEQDYDELKYKELKQKYE